jgi:hypothetical protein
VLRCFDADELNKAFFFMVGFADELNNPLVFDLVIVLDGVAPLFLDFVVKLAVTQIIVVEVASIIFDEIIQVII